MTTICPTDAELRELLLGRGPDSVGEHLIDCPHCGSKAGQLVATDPLLADLRAAHDTSEVGTDGTFVEELLKRVRKAPAKPVDKELDFLDPPQAEYSTDLGLFSHYRIVEKIGQGGMGLVFRAVDTNLQRTVALKIILPKYAENKKLRDRFIEEARATVKVRSPHVAEVYETNVWRDVPYLTMELLVGTTLDKKPKPMSLDAWRRVGYSIAKGLADAHRSGMIHRDLKPSNIHLGTDSRTGKPTVKLIDFGLARPVNRDIEITKSGELLGTPAYMSPEQARGKKVDHRTDLYSLGVILHQLATGKLPYDSADEGVMAILTELATPEPLTAVSTRVAGLSPALANLIDRLLAKDPANRPASADEVMKVLRDSLNAKVDPNASGTAVAVSEPFVSVPDSTGAYEPSIAFSEMKTEPDAPAPKPGRRWLWPALGVGTALAALLIAFALGAFTVKVKTKDGTIEIADLPADAEVVVDGNVVTLTWDAGKTKATATIPAGQHMIEVKASGITTTGERVTLAAGERKPVTFQFRKPDQPTPTTVVRTEQPPYGKELIQNGGCDDAALSHWTRVSGGWYQNHHDRGPTFCAGDCAYGVLQQEVDVSAFAKDIDSGEVGFGFHVLFSTYDADTTRCVVQYLDAKGKILGDGYDTGERAHRWVWVTYSGMVIAPAGTRTALVVLQSRRSRRPGNKQNSGYYDDVSLWAVHLPKGTESVPLYKSKEKADYTNALGMKFVRVPAGATWLDGYSGKPGEREVTFPTDYYLGMYEVTQAEWQKVMGSNPSHFSRNGKGAAAVKDEPDATIGQLPVESITANDAAKFLAKLNELTKESGWVYRLPTGDEWEYACRGGPIPKSESGFDFYAGRPGYSLSAALGNFDLANKRTLPVGSYPPNRLGLFDMHGNVWEMLSRPTDVNGKPVQICRGGCWDNVAAHCRAAHSMRYDPPPDNFAFGLRLVRVPAPAGPTFTNALDMKFVRVPKGRAWQGGSNDKPGDREVNFAADFFLGQFEVTQEEWRRVMDKNPSHFARDGGGKTVVRELTDETLKRLPVESISWDDCQEFIRRVNEQTKETGWVYRLPTGPEWEYACRGGPMADPAESRFGYYLAQPTNSITGQQANYAATGYGRTCPVGTFAPNKLGLFDMHGNVWEYLDERHNATDRYGIGGSWNNKAHDNPVSLGQPVPRSAIGWNIGLRLVRVPAPAGPTFTNSIGMKFARVPKGTVLLGGRDGKPGTVQATIAEDFYLGTYEVTQEEWRAVMGTTPALIVRPSPIAQDTSAEAQKRFPVNSVTWLECREFAKKLNERLKEPGWEYRLPTEKEWEYACRGGPSNDPSVFGFSYYAGEPSNTLAPNQANFGDLLKNPCKVGSYAPNRLGLYDMHGNVSEWCNDEKTPPERDASGKEARINRGGSHWENADYCRPTWASRWTPNERHRHVGLRIARVPIPGFVPIAPNANARTIDLLALVDVDRDSVKGKWTRGADGIASDNSAFCRIKFPYGPVPAEYDFRVEFTAKGGGNDVLQLLSAGGSNFSFLMGAWGGKWDGFDAVTGHPLTRDGGNIIGGPTSIKRNTRHTVVISVRKDSVSATIDGKLVVKHATNYADLRMPNEWKIGDGLLGLGTTIDPTTFHKAELVDLTAVAVAPAPAPVPAPVPANGFVSLFNGQDRTGWLVDGGDANQWTIENGAIVGRRSKDDKTGRNFFLVDRDFSDYTLRFDFQVGDDTSLGAVALRADVGEKVPFDDQQQIFDHPTIKLTNPAHGGLSYTGSANWLMSSKQYILPRTKPTVVVGQWHAVEITVKGDTCTASFDGVACVDLKLDPVAPTPFGFVPGLKRTKGKVGFQINTGTMRYRNVSIQELAPTVSAPNAKLAPLFNGKDLTGWEAIGNANATWKVENGELVGGWKNSDFVGGSTLATRKKDYRHFRLRVTSKPAEHYASRIYALPGINPSGPGGYFKVWLGTEKGEVGGETGRLTMRAADDAPLLAKAKVAANEWNTIEIEVRGNRVQVSVDGVKTADQTDDRLPAAGNAIGLHLTGGSVLRIKSVEIEELESPAAVAAAKRREAVILDSLVVIQEGAKGRERLGVVTGSGICTIMPGTFKDVQLATVDGKRTVAGTVSGRSPFPFCWIDPAKADLPRAVPATAGEERKAQDAYVAILVDGKPEIHAGKLDANGAFASPAAIAPKQGGIVFAGPIFAADGSFLGLGMRTDLDRPILLQVPKKN